MNRVLFLFNLLLFLAYLCWKLSSYKLSGAVWCGMVMRCRVVPVLAR